MRRALSLRGTRTRATRPTRRWLVGAGLVLASGSLPAQPYVDGGSTRHRFAQLTLGLDTRVFPAAASSEGDPLHELRLLVGGTHFWGHADFYVAFPVRRVGGSAFRTRTETGARLYPWRITRDRVRPWIGASLMAVEYERGAGPREGRLRWPVSAGLTYQRGAQLITAGAGVLGYRAQYPTSPTARVPIAMHPRVFSLAYTRSMDLTLGAEREWLSGATADSVAARLADGSIGGWTVGLGPSTAFFTRTSPALRALGYAGQHRHARSFVDLSVGYHFPSPDLQLGMAYRHTRSALSAYGFSQVASRRAVTAEAYRFLFDYHGFVPFVGPHLSWEQLRVSGTQRGATDRLAPGVTFGWDIRPNRLQTLVLRTNLRYTPGLRVPVTGGRSVAFDQLEFNFIQFVIFPNRFL